MRKIENLKEVSHGELVLHAVLLHRTVNNHWAKEEDLKSFDQIPDTELIEYIVHFYDPEPEIDWDEFCKEEAEYERKYGYGYDDYDRHYTPSATNGDYSPSCPWNAPGMSIHDFI